MQKYGIVRDGKLLLVPKGTPDAKLVVFGEIPEFDQETQAVYQIGPVEREDDIYVGVEIRYVELDEGELEGFEELN
ncbi:MAG TPA: hypothetical protein GX530_10310 [Corynebacteriales bacterium]|nr:hypothetical protein [Mycobacteriales bacterium]